MMTSLMSKNESITGYDVTNFKKDWFIDDDGTNSKKMIGLEMMVSSLMQKNYWFNDDDVINYKE